jgi:hypothetical protein
MRLFSKLIKGNKALLVAEEEDLLIASILEDL